MSHLAIALITVSPQLLFADEPSKLTDNEELTHIFKMDQSDREPGPDGIDGDVIGQRDAERRTRTLEILRSGEVRTSEDFRHAAYVFQHGETIEDYRLALSLAWMAATIDPNNEDAKWLTAAAWDRLLMNQGQPQWYGTQYRTNDGGSSWRLYDIQEGAVTDEQRQELNVPTLDESNARLKRLYEK